jgi:hypothetical protein
MLFEGDLLFDGDLLFEGVLATAAFILLGVFDGLCIALGFFDGVDVLFHTQK